MRRFELHRDEDESGVSGTGVVAEGIEFSDKQAVIHWIVGEHRCTSIWRNVEAVEAVHGHEGRTKVVYLDA